MSDNDMAYIARMSCCGKVVMATVDRPEYKKDVAKSTSEAIKRGDIVERVTVAQVREIGWATHEHACGLEDCDGKPTRAGIAKE